MADKQPAEPKVKFSNQAIKKLTEVVQSNNAAGLRLEIKSRQHGQFEHVLSVIEPGKQPADDIPVKVNGIPVPVYLERRNVAYLDGLRVHYEYKGADQSGLEFANPNPLWLGATEKQLQSIVDTQLNPAIAAHGGFINLIAVENGTAYIEMGGGCVGCGMADVTLKQGVEASIIGVVPGIERIVDTTDHASGTNPYYQPSKK